MAKQDKKNQVLPDPPGPPTAGLGTINNYAGAQISLNQKRSTYFGVGVPGAFKIWLNPSHWSQVVPDGLTDEESTVLAKALSDGIIVMGKEWLPAINKDPAVKEKYLELCRKGRLTRIEDPGSAKKPFVDLVRRKTEGGYTALEIISYVKDEESKTRSRAEWLTFLQDAINHYEGPVQLVQDFPDDPDNYKVTIDTTSYTVVKDSRKEDGDFVIPVGPEHTEPELTAEEKNEKLNEFFSE